MDQHIKTSFDPISNKDTLTLILGTMPGDKSLALGQYYGHPRNRFWKIISTLTNNELPVEYSDKKDLLLKLKIGVWDVAHVATRKGSLDKNILFEEPNDLDAFMLKHTNLRTVAFNGTKAQNLFDKYFTRREDLTYILLPSSSPANAAINFQVICMKWKQAIR